MSTEPKEVEVVQPKQGKKRTALQQVPVAELAVVQGPSMETVLMKAVEQGASIETIERIFAMIEKANAAAAKREYFSALSAFQAAMPIVPKKKKVTNRDGVSARFYYAPMDYIKDLAKPHLAANGLSVTTGCRVVDNRLIACATANHIGGHSETREFEVPITLSQFMSDPQSFAAASSFAERYAFRHVLGIVTTDDDNETRLTPNEAREARGTVRMPQTTPTAQKAAQKGNGAERKQLEPAPTEEDAISAEIGTGLAKAMKHATLSASDFTKRFGLDRLGQIQKSDVQTVMSWIADPVRN